MIAEVKSTGVDEELRKLISRFFMDKESRDYQNDPNLWQRVKGLGGRIIEEFTMLGLR